MPAGWLLMPALYWQTLVLAASVLNIIAWGFPLVLLTTLAYYIEKYTRFRTKWRLVFIATLLSLVHPTLILFDHQTLGEVNPLHEAASSIILLAGVILGVHASIGLLKFQRIELGKTKDIVEILATTGFVIPSLAYLYGRLSALMTLSFIAHNTSIALLALIFLIIGKTIRNYIPKQGGLQYSIVVFASILISLNLLFSNYTYVSKPTSDYWNVLRLFGLLSQLTGNILLALVAFMLVREAKIRGTHIIPLEEGKTDKPPIRYRLKKGFSYLISDADGRKGFGIFNEYIANKYHGLGITRTKPERIREEYGLRTTPILWMSTAETEYKSVKPNDLERLLLIIKDFIAGDSKSILLIERFDYLIAENGFQRILNFIHRLNDVIVSSECMLLVSTNLNTLTVEQRNQLLQEFENLSEADDIVLSEPQYELLSFIFTENGSGRRPSFKKITDRFNITKTTTRKRVHELEGKGLVKIIEDGKFKLLEVTEAGGDLMKNPVGPMGW